MDAVADAGVVANVVGYAVLVGRRALVGRKLKGLQLPLVEEVNLRRLAGGALRPRHNTAVDIRDGRQPALLHNSLVVVAVVVMLETRGPPAIDVMN